MKADSKQVLKSYNTSRKSPSFHAELVNYLQTNNCFQGFYQFRTQKQNIGPEFRLHKCLARVKAAWLPSRTNCSSLYRNTECCRQPDNRLYVLQNYTNAHSMYYMPIRTAAMELLFPISSRTSKLFSRRLRNVLTNYSIGSRLL